MALRDFWDRLPLEWLVGRRPPLVVVLRLDGAIGLRDGRGLSLIGLAGAIERAFSQRTLSAVALAVNSPGGSPVQSALIFRRIRQFAAEKKVPVYAFAEDVAASGGYWLLLAGDEIYAEEASLVGSIGVVSAGFGFHEVLKRVGVQRRLYTAGDRKALLDPFLAEDPRGIERLTEVQREVHETFKDLVRERRGPKLTAGEDVLFNGDVFTGRSALRHGLIDGIGDLRGTLRARFGEKVRLRLVPTEKRRRWWPLPWPVGRSRAGVGEVAAEALAAIEERLLWNRFGL
jgi:signal peptide peptidase SppA